jgi:FAD/FMN-containing dehydrogenase
MAREHSAALEAMRRVKHALDPRGLLNPAKVLPDDGQDP